MQVVLRANSTDYVLAHGAARGLGLHVGPDASCSHDSSVLAQIDPIVGASNRFVAERGNRISNIPFGVQVQFATIDEATRYAFVYPITLPRSGTLYIKPDVGNWVKFEPCVIERVNLTQFGCTVQIRYTVVGVGGTVITPLP